MRRAVTLIEVLIATFILATLGLTIYDTMVGTVRGIGIDRLNETRRQLVLDLLERFAQPYSDIAYVYPPNAASPAVRLITVDEAMEMVAIPASERARIKSILESGGFQGFTMVWHRGLATGLGRQNRLRKDRLWIYSASNVPRPGASVDSFRVFYVREP